MWLCLLTAIALNGQFLAASEASEDSRSAVRIFAVAAQTPALQAHSGTQRVDSSKQRNQVSWCLTPPAGSGRLPDFDGTGVAGSKGSHARTSAAQNRSGRAPPSLIS